MKRPGFWCTTGSGSLLQSLGPDRLSDSQMLPPAVLCVVGLGWNILVFCGSAQPPLSRIPAVCTILRSRAVFQDSTESGLSATCWGRASDP